MAEGNLPVAQVGNTWTDITTLEGLDVLSGAPCVLQNRSTSIVFFAFSESAEEPAADAGQGLRYFDTCDGTATHIWVRAVAQAQVAAQLKDG